MVQGHGSDSDSSHGKGKGRGKGRKYRNGKRNGVRHSGSPCLHHSATRQRSESGSLHLLGMAW